MPRPESASVDLYEINGRSTWVVTVDGHLYTCPTDAGSHGMAFPGVGPSMKHLRKGGKAQVFDGDHDQKGVLLPVTWKGPKILVITSSGLCEWFRTLEEATNLLDQALGPPLSGFAPTIFMSDDELPETSVSERPSVRMRRAIGGRSDSNELLARPDSGGEGDEGAER